MFFEVTVSICYAARERPYTTRHPFRTENAAHTFITRRTAEIIAQRPAWSVLSDIRRAREYSTTRTVAIAHRNEVQATLRLETRHFEDDLEETLSEQTVIPEEADKLVVDAGPDGEEPVPDTPDRPHRHRATSRIRKNTPSFHGKGKKHGGGRKRKTGKKPRRPDTEH